MVIRRFLSIFTLFEKRHAEFDTWVSSNSLLYSKNGKLQKRGKVNLIGKLQLSTERSKEEDNEGIVQLRILRVQVKNKTSGNVRKACVINDNNNNNVSL